MRKTVVLNVVGLTPDLLSKMPRLTAWSTQGQQVSIRPQLPAVTCTAQACYLTGKAPSEHGIVANGWYFRDECEVKFWRQSNHLVQSPKIWDVARSIDPSFTCANLFWWYNMYSSADISVTPRPMYPADGRKLPDIYTQPAPLRDELQAELGRFPLFKFWGPKTSIQASEWIAAAAKQVEARHAPTLTLVYIPHLDYCLQQQGPSAKGIAQDLDDADRVVSDLIDFYEARDTQVIVLSEYGITDVNHPIHINRILREQGYLSIREELGKELLDPGSSRAFAIADHQLAHVYVQDEALIPGIRQKLLAMPGIESVWEGAEKAEHGFAHERAGELIAVAKPDAWFTYYYWLDDDRAPDFARTVDIHRKPGYDPVELFVDPQLRWPWLTVASKLAQKKLGFRTLLDVIPLDASLVKGSHGAMPPTPQQGPLLISQQGQHLPSDRCEATEVFDLLLSHLLGLPSQTRRSPEAIGSRR